ncbi:hypothetical protein As57867_007776, partial [Aphanomyces stellatus]
MTCNPRWKEIDDALEFLKNFGMLTTKELVHYRGEIICRVFNMKLKQLMAGIKSGDEFGPYLYGTYVVEFQKRGLPHAHILLGLVNPVKYPDQIDGFVSAEMPDPVTQPQLYSIISSQNLHRCDNRCLEKGKCSKNFPKPFVEATQLDDNGFPHYRRRCTNPQNAILVPYCPSLSLRFNCHINVEICTSIKSVKYLYKYIHK